MITGDTLITWGFRPGRWFQTAIAAANRLAAEGAGEDAIFAHVQTLAPVEVELRTNARPFGVFLDPASETERANLALVVEHMDALMRTPTIVKGAVMPDACPSGTAPGTIPVGGAVACEDAIHPGFHSSDICCSVACTVFGRADEPRRILDAMQTVTHFGPGGRAKPAKAPAFDFSGNPFLRDLETVAAQHFATQGDGNHFAYVGHLKSTGQPALVTHHGSRGLGAQLYKRGMAAARKHAAIHAPRLPAHNAWIKASSREGEQYWAALQTVRAWTKASHYALHDLVAAAIGNAVVDRFWNEHNFVFRRDDGLFYHGKGATPSWTGYAGDDDGRTLIPLNMAEPILIARHRDRAEALGFAPHGAGRNMGRKAFLRQHAPTPPEGIDLRFWCGRMDASELPEAYKDAASVRAQIAAHGLAEIVDEILPYGTIMAGDWAEDAPWRRRKTAASG